MVGRLSQENGIERGVLAMSEQNRALRELAAVHDSGRPDRIGERFTQDFRLAGCVGLAAGVVSLRIGGMPSRPREFHPEHRVVGSSRPPPTPTERSVRSYRTTLFDRWFTALCYLFKFRFHGQLIFSLNRRLRLPLDGAHVAQEQFTCR